MEDACMDGNESPQVPVSIVAYARLALAVYFLRVHVNGIGWLITCTVGGCVNLQQ